jgi:hypothetical protein
MNLSALLFGEKLQELGIKTASNLIGKAVSNNKQFANIFANSKSKTIHIEDLDLSREEEIEIHKITEMAMNKGLEKIDIEIRSINYSLNIKDNSLTALVS